MMLSQTQIIPQSKQDNFNYIQNINTSETHIEYRSSMKFPTHSHVHALSTH